MRFRFFTIPVFDTDAGERELNGFLAEHVVLAVDRELVRDPNGTVWAVCVRFVDRDEAGKTASSPKKGRIDYREVLSDEDFAVYAKLRDLRKQRAEEHGLPAYTLFTDEQLAAMVTGRARSKADLSAIEGIGEARVDKWAEAFLAVLAACFGEGGHA